MVSTLKSRGVCPVKGAEYLLVVQPNTLDFLTLADALENKGGVI